jgi:beta-galactosidase GanA
MSPFYYGTQFYRPPNPPRSERRQHLERIAGEAGFNIIKIWPTWTWFNPSEGEFDFDELHEMMAACDELGLKVVVNPSLESAPYWLEQKYPDSRFVNALGDAMYLRGMQTNPTGGWPGLCLDHPQVREQADLFLTTLAQKLDGYDSLLVWDCWNEPMIEPSRGSRIWATPDERLFCYCPHTIAAYRGWLQERYGSVADLNEAWARRFSDWEQIEPPRVHGTYADWLDWRRFIIENMVGQMRFRYKALRAGDGHRHPIMSHITQMQSLPQDADGAQLETIGKRQYTFQGCDPWRLAEVCDMWGTSLFPKGWKASAAEMAQRLDLTRSSAQGKEWWNSETEGGGVAGTGLKTIDYVRPNDIRMENWMCVAYGAKAIMYWQWLSEVTGMEGRRWGLIDRDGRTTDRVREAARMARLINDQWDIIEGFEPEARVALLFDSDIPLMCFALDGDEEPSVESHVGYYRAVWEADLKADIIPPQYLSPEQYDVVIVPFYPLLVPETAAKLRTFVEAGGLLIAESGFGLYDYHGMAHTTVPPYGLDEVAGLQEAEPFYTDHDAPEALDEIQRAPWLTFSEPVSGQVRAHTYVTSLLLRGAEPIGSYGKITVGAHYRFGQGEVYYFGTNLGGAICRGDIVAKQMVKTLLLKRVLPSMTGVKLRPRCVTGGDGALLVVVNEHDEAQTEVLTLPEGYGQVKDLLGERTLPLDDQRLSVTVPARDVAVFRTVNHQA